MKALYYNLCLLNFIFMSSCAENEHNFGFHEINQKLVLEFEKSNFKKYDTIVLNSPGGFPNSALEISDLIAENSIHLVVNTECTSACANIILPSAKSLKFENNPVIGFHWDDTMNRKMLEKHAVSSLAQCDWTSEIKYQNLLRKAKLNPDFWQQTELRLNLLSYEVVPKLNECPWKKRKFENEMWLPRSDQLRNLWGLRFKGNVCADNFSKCTLKVDKLWKKNSRIVIGDEVYVSKGRQP